MSELIHRFVQNPLLGLELLAISFFVNLLGLASPIFVMLVLGRYVGFGVDSTLVTLVVGVVIAITAELVFRSIRLKYAYALVEGIHNEASGATFGMLTAGDFVEIGRLAPRLRNEVSRDLELVSNTYSAPNLCILLDVPFGTIFVLVLYFISPQLSLIVLAFIVCAVVARLIWARFNASQMRSLANRGRAAVNLIDSALGASESVRAFDADQQLLQKWKQSSKVATQSRISASLSQGNLEAFSMTLQALMSAAVISVGALYVVAGELTVSQLIGGNIFAARALSPIVRFSSLLSAFNNARLAMARLRSLADIPRENNVEKGRRIQTNALELRDVTFAYDNNSAPVIEGLNLKLEPGSIVLIDGKNGAGKTTLLRLLLGLLHPQKGQVLADGVDLNQVAAREWRKSVAYVPQEPSFLNFSIRENITIAAPGITDQDITSAIEAGGMRSFVDTAPGGLDFLIERNGDNLAWGIRKRLALVRALLGQKTIAVFDEPTEGLDQDGKAHVYRALNDMSSAGCTIVLVSDDEHIRKGAQTVLSLDELSNLRQDVGQNSGKTGRD